VFFFEKPMHVTFYWFSIETLTALNYLVFAKVASFFAHFGDRQTNRRTIASCKAVFAIASADLIIIIITLIVRSPGLGTYCWNCGTYSIASSFSIVFFRKSSSLRFISSILAVSWTFFKLNKHQLSVNTLQAGWASVTHYTNNVSIENFNLQFKVRDCSQSSMKFEPASETV